jgi:predicted MFS family arabinose efflux permease
LLPTGSLAFLIGSALTERLARIYPRSAILTIGAIGMGVVAALIFNYHPAVAFTVSVGFVMGIFAGLRAASSSTLALDQLPDKPGAMMAARTAAVQIGYLIGASIGGIAVDVAGYRSLGLLMIVGMSVSAAVMYTVPAGRAEPAIT